MWGQIPTFLKFYFEIQPFFILALKIPIIKMPEMPYNKGFPDKKLTPLGLGGSNGVTHITDKIDDMFLCNKGFRFQLF